MIFEKKMTCFTDDSGYESDKWRRKNSSLDHWKDVAEMAKTSALYGKKFADGEIWNPILFRRWIPTQIEQLKQKLVKYENKVYALQTFAKSEKTIMRRVPRKYIDEEYVNEVAEQRYARARRRAEARGRVFRGQLEQFQVEIREQAKYYFARHPEAVGHEFYLASIRSVILPMSKLLKIVQTELIKLAKLEELKAKELVERSQFYTVEVIDEFYYSIVQAARDYLEDEVVVNHLSSVNTSDSCDDFDKPSAIYKQIFKETMNAMEKIANVDLYVEVENYNDILQKYKVFCSNEEDPYWIQRALRRLFREMTAYQDKYIIPESVILAYLRTGIYYTLKQEILFDGNLLGCKNEVDAMNKIKAVKTLDTKGINAMLR